MTESHVDRLRLHRRRLLEILDVSEEFKASLLANGSITAEHLENVNKFQSEPRKQIATLVDILERRSQKHYEKFLDALAETEQEHVLEIFQADTRVVSCSPGPSDTAAPHGSVNTSGNDLVFSQSDRIVCREGKLMFTATLTSDQETDSQQLWQELSQIDGIYLNLCREKSGNVVIHCEAEYDKALERRLVQILAKSAADRRTENANSGDTPDTEYTCELMNGQLTLTVKTQTGSRSQDLALCTSDSFYDGNGHDCSREIMDFLGNLIKPVSDQEFRYSPEEQVEEKPNSDTTKKSFVQEADKTDFRFAHSCTGERQGGNKDHTDMCDPGEDSLTTLSASAVQNKSHADAKCLCCGTGGTQSETITSKKEEGSRNSDTNHSNSDKETRQRRDEGGTNAIQNGNETNPAPTPSVQKKSWWQSFKELLQRLVRFLFQSRAADVKKATVFIVC